MPPHAVLCNTRSFLLILLLSIALEHAFTSASVIRPRQGGLALGRTTTVPLVPQQGSALADTDSEGSKAAARLPLPPSILHQQHINRGWKRLALMNHLPVPSDRQLLSNLHQRIKSLPDHLRKLYAYKQLSQWLEGMTGEVAAKPPANTGLDIQANDIGYMATFLMGTPSRPFQLLVDSGSADFWVGEDRCRNDDGGDCGNHNYLGPASSTSFNASDAGKAGESTWFIGYMTGRVSGYVGQDTVSVAGLTMEDYSFGVALNESLEFKDVPFDGIAGFAKADASKQRVPTFLNALYQQNLIDQPIVSYHLPRVRDAKPNGEMTLGGLNPLAYQPSTLVSTPNVNKFGFWGSKIGPVRIGNTMMSSADRTMLFDTGTALMIVPEKDAREIHTAIPNSTFTSGAWMVPCTMDTVIVVHIQGQDFSIDPRDIAFTPIDDNYPLGMCWSGIGVGSVGPYNLEHDWLAGAVFLKNVYFVTDDSKDQISFAKLRH